MEGLSAATYDLGDGAARIGSVKVWSRGAHEQGDNAVVHVGFTIDNGSDRPIVFDGRQVALESVHAEGQILRDIAPRRQLGPIAVPPNASQNVELAFVMPRGFEPTDVNAFRIRWTTEAGGQRYTQYTPFVQYERQAVVPLYAYYDPYWEPYWHPYWRPYNRVIVVREQPRRVLIPGGRGDRPTPPDRR